MVETPEHADHYHEPLLVFELRSLMDPRLLNRIDYQLIPDLYGRPLVVIPLTGRAVQIAASNPSGRQLEIPGPEPKDRTRVTKPCLIKWLGKGNIDSLHWLMPIDLLNIKALDGDILTKGKGDKRVAAHVSLPYGTMACDDLIVDENGGHIIFESKNSDGEVQAKSLIADFGTVTIPGVDTCVEVSDEDCLSLKLKSNGESTIVASVVNMPPRYPTTEPGPELVHLPMLYPLSAVPIPPSKQRKLVAGFGFTPGSEACPVPTWFYD